MEHRIKNIAYTPRLISKFSIGNLVLFGNYKALQYITFALGLWGFGNKRAIFLGR